MNKYIYIAIILTVTLPSYTYAYIGPSVGVGVLGTIIGICSAIFLAIFGILYYPVKRFIRKIKSKK